MLPEAGESQGRTRRAAVFVTPRAAALLARASDSTPWNTSSIGFVNPFDRASVSGARAGVARESAEAFRRVRRWCLEMVARRVMFTLDAR
jgi:hypothetical protein